MPAVLAVERKRPARIGTGATVLLDELLHGREGAVLGDLLLDEVDVPWLLALRGDDEDVKRADVIARAARQPSLGHVVLHRHSVRHDLCAGIRPCEPSRSAADVPRI